MSDISTSSTHLSWIQRIGAAGKGLIFELLLFVVGFPILFSNENRSVKRARTLDEGEGACLSIAASPIDSANDGRLVHFSGRAVTDEVLSDDVFGIAISNELRLVRSVEMFQWSESSKTNTKKNLGGSEDQVTTYSYERIWAANLINSASFYTPEGHENPETIQFDEESFVANSVHVGDFVIPASSVATIGEPVCMNFNPSSNSLPAYLPAFSMRTAHGYYIPVQAGGSSAAPQIGDVRVVFKHVPQQDVSFIAKQHGGTIVPFHMKNGTIFEQRDGIADAVAMFQSSRTSNRILTWLLRCVGFFMMFIGLSMVLKPLTVLGDVVPFIGRIIGFGAGIIAFLVASVCALTTIAVAWITVRPFVCVSLVLVIAGIVVAVMKFGRKKDIK